MEKKLLMETKTKDDYSLEVGSIDRIRRLTRRTKGALGTFLEIRQVDVRLPRSQKSVIL